VIDETDDQGQIILDSDDPANPYRHGYVVIMTKSRVYHATPECYPVVRDTWLHTSDVAIEVKDVYGDPLTIKRGEIEAIGLGTRPGLAGFHRYHAWRRTQKDAPTWE